jgi:hypothetical protein
MSEPDYGVSMSSFTLVDGVYRPGWSLNGPEVTGVRIPIESAGVTIMTRRGSKTGLFYSPQTGVDHPVQDLVNSDLTATDFRRLAAEYTSAVVEQVDAIHGAQFGFTRIGKGVEVRVVLVLREGRYPLQVSAGEAIAVLFPETSL